MNQLFGLLFLMVFLSGCAGSAAPCIPKGFSKDINYTAATRESKSRLAEDLRSGKLSLKAELDDIRKNYGDADDIFVSGCNVRIIYRRDSGKNITLWFEDSRHLSMWSN